MRNLIQCPHCFSEGKIRNLAEILPDGYIKIQRMVSSKPGITRDFTLIKGLDFVLRCGECGNDVFIKQEGRKNEVSSEWSERFYRFSLSQSIAGFGTSSKNYAGTALSA